MKKLLLILIVALLFSCDKNNEEETEDLSEPFVEITAITPPDSSIVGETEEITISIKYNIPPGELDMLGYYIIHETRSDYDIGSFYPESQILSKWMLIAIKTPACHVGYFATQIIFQLS